MRAGPVSVTSISNHVTGVTVPLYQFPEVKHPLPVIPSIEEMQVCPLTGDKNFEATRKLVYD